MAFLVLFCTLFEMLVALAFFIAQFISLPCRCASKRSAILVNRRRQSSHFDGPPDSQTSEPRQPLLTQQESQIADMPHTSQRMLGTQGRGDYDSDLLLRTHDERRTMDTKRGKYATNDGDAGEMV